MRQPSSRMVIQIAIPGELQDQISAVKHIDPAAGEVVGIGEVRRLVIAGGCVVAVAERIDTPPE